MKNPFLFSTKNSLDSGFFLYNKLKAFQIGVGKIREVQSHSPGNHLSDQEADQSYEPLVKGA